ncbi:MAG: hypothetical protein ACI9TH_004660 [Kiritimatiellia bacterium]|jgi:hypothetical protein
MRASRFPWPELPFKTDKDRVKAEALMEQFAAVIAGGHIEYAMRLIDLEGFVNRMLPSGYSSPEMVEETSRGYREMISTSLRGIHVQADGIFFHYLYPLGHGGRNLFICRIIRDIDAGYFGFELHTLANGSLLITDVYIYEFGKKFSDSMRLLIEDLVGGLLVRTL